MKFEKYQGLAGYLHESKTNMAIGGLAFIGAMSLFFALYEKYVVMSPAHIPLITVAVVNFVATIGLIIVSTHVPMNSKSKVQVYMTFMVYHLTHFVYIVLSTLVSFLFLSGFLYILVAILEF